jgi:hypothetical protein
MHSVFKQKLGLDSCPYMIRWILNFKRFSIRIHHWLSSDDKQNFHDHPWWFWSFCLRGSYIDVSPNGIDFIYPGKLTFRRALHQHTVLVTDDCWTIMLTGKEVRKWGFWINNKFKKANKYFFEKGHHPCEDGQSYIRTSTPKK